jgi:hypothetical protein
VNGSITAVFTACSAASGRPFTAPKRGSVTLCCFHEDRLASLSISEAKGTFHCFAASCGRQGGILAVPIAFGLARNVTDSSRWLAERNLIAKADHSLAGAPSAPRATPRSYTRPEELPEELADLRRVALRDLVEEVGSIRFRAVRDAIAEIRAEREARGQRRFQDTIDLFQRYTAQKERVA